MFFDITLSFSGSDAIVDAELIDVFESEFLAFRSVSIESAALACELFAGTPDAAHDMVVCDLGTLIGPITVQAEFEAIKATTPDRTLDEASAEFDPDGDGPEGRRTVGPDPADVEIVEVLALPPLGDEPAAGAATTSNEAAVLLAGLAVVLALAGRSLTASRQRS